MRFREKLKNESQKTIWDDYCGFLDLSMEEYMQIQKSLLDEQIDQMAQCGLGRRIMKGAHPTTFAEFQEQIPLTTYEDYADILLNERVSELPGEPVVWLETTWESGSRPKKVAPYTREMLDTYARNILAAMILSTSEERGKFAAKNKDRVLYGLAPLPYATGLFPYLIAPEIDIRFMPSLKEAKNLSFSQQNKVGFKEAMKYGIDQFFGMSSIVYTITKNFSSFTSSGAVSFKSLIGIRPAMLWRILKAKYICARDERPMQPKDLFDLKGFVCVGTDTALFKDELERAWGRRPLEVHGGTEPSCVGTETWKRNGLVFFPDNALYEFIPRDEMMKNLDDPSYVPRTYLMNEVVAGEEYELVLTLFKGGAFMRYRPGDMYRCLRTFNEAENLQIPQFEYIDRIPTVIDIAGFTRITEKSITEVLMRSRLAVGRWCGLKEYNSDKNSYLHFLVEIDALTPESVYLNEQIIREHFGVYYRQYDHDYNDLKRLLGAEPLKVTLLPLGTIDRLEKRLGHKIRKINPSSADIMELRRMRGGGEI